MSKETLARLEKILRKIVDHADDAKNGSHAYAYDRLEQIRALAAYGVERVIGEDRNEGNWIDMD